MASIEGGEAIFSHEAMEGEDYPDGKTAGYVSGLATLLLMSSGGVPQAFAGGHGPFFVYGPNPLGEGPDTHYIYEVHHEEDPDFIIKLEEEDAAGDTAKVTGFKYNGSGTPTNHVFKYHLGGQYQDASGESYLEWGYWEDQTGPPDAGKVGQNGSFYYAVDSKIWHIKGNTTAPEYLDYLARQNAVYDYAGEGKGAMVYYNGSTPSHYPLTGDFSMTIDFGTRHVDHFELDLGDGMGHTFKMHATDGTLEANGEFDIDNLSGSFNGSVAIDPSKSDAGGHVFGPKADGVGGGYNAYGKSGSDEYWAVGEFHGDRP
jgi:hypothetical protein